MIYGRERLRGDGARRRRATTRWSRRSAATASSSTEPDQIRPALERACASGKPACVNVMIRQDFEFKGGIYM